VYTLQSGRKLLRNPKRVLLDLSEIDRKWKVLCKLEYKVKSIAREGVLGTFSRSVGGLVVKCNTRTLNVL
jgi:hypothetical protein